MTLDTSILLLLAACAPKTPPAVLSDPATWQPFESDAGVGYRDPAGAVTIAPRFVHAAPFGDRPIAWAIEPERTVWIDATGAVVARAFVFDNGADDFAEGLTRIVDDAGRVGFMDEQGAVVLAPRYDFATPFEHGAAIYCLGCAPESDDEHAALVGGAWGAVDPTGADLLPATLPSWEAARAALDTAR